MDNGPLALVDSVSRVVKDVKVIIWCLPDSREGEELLLARLICELTTTLNKTKLNKVIGPVYTVVIVSRTYPGPHLDAVSARERVLI